MLAAWSLRPGPGEARTWLQHELARAEYHQQSLTDRFYAWLAHLWHSLTSTASHANGLSTAAAILVAVVFVAVIITALSRLTRRATAPAARGPVAVSAVETAAEHRSRAETALSQGDAGTAVVEATRALARRMVDRGVLEDTPGSTALEIAVALAHSYPDERDSLLEAAAAFDAVHYGDRQVTLIQAARVLHLDDRLRTARPVGGSRVTVGSAVPR